MNNLAPIVLFTFKKLKPLKQTITALLKNNLAKDSELFVFSDAPRDMKDQEQVSLVRNYLKTIIGFKNITIKEANVNQGLSISIISGVTEIINLYDKVIVLEDDLIVSDNFLNYMNAALSFYSINEKVASVCGYTFPIESTDIYDAYFTKRSSSWGWGTWKYQWNKVDWDVKDYNNFLLDRKLHKEFNKMGSDLTGMLNKQMTGQISSWAIRWTYFQFKNNLLSVHPKKSKVSNEGFGLDATHTVGSQMTRFATSLDISSKTSFTFPSEPYLDPAIIKQFIERYSWKTRFIYKLKGILFNFFLSL